MEGELTKWPYDVDTIQQCSYKLQENACQQNCCYLSIHCCLCKAPWNYNNCLLSFLRKIYASAMVA